MERWDHVWARQMLERLEPYLRPNLTFEEKQIHLQDGVLRLAGLELARKKMMEGFEAGKRFSGPDEPAIVKAPNHA